MCNYYWLFMLMWYEGMHTENKENKKRWINYVKYTIAFDFIDCKVYDYFNDNWIDRMEK